MLEVYNVLTDRQVDRHLILYYIFMWFKMNISARKNKFNYFYGFLVLCLFNNFFYSFIYNILQVVFFDKWHKQKLWYTKTCLFSGENCISNSPIAE